MKIVIFEQKNTAPWLSKLLNKDKYNHVAILLNHGRHCYITDSSREACGTATRNLIDFPSYLKNRPYIIYSISTADLDFAGYRRASELRRSPWNSSSRVESFIRRLLGLKTSSYNCFEYAIEILKQYYIIEDKEILNPDAQTVTRLAERYGIKGEYLNCKKVG